MRHPNPAPTLIRLAFGASTTLAGLAVIATSISATTVPSASSRGTAPRLRGPQPAPILISAIIPAHHIDEDAMDPHATLPANWFAPPPALAFMLPQSAAPIAHPVEFAV